VTEIEVKGLVADWTFAGKVGDFLSQKDIERDLAEEGVAIVVGGDGEVRYRTRWAWEGVS
jgi:hypothetical protein